MKVFFKKFLSKIKWALYRHSKECRVRTRMYAVGKEVANTVRKEFDADPAWQAETKKWLGKFVWGWCDDPDPAKNGGYDLGIVTGVQSFAGEREGYVYFVTGISISRLVEAPWSLNSLDEALGEDSYRISTRRCVYISEALGPLPFPGPGK